MAATQYPNWGAMYVHVSWLPSWCTRPRPLFSHVPVGFRKEVQQGTWETPIAGINVYKSHLKCHINNLLGSQEQWSSNL